MSSLLKVTCEHSCRTSNRTKLMSDCALLFALSSNACTCFLAGPRSGVAKVSVVANRGSRRTDQRTTTVGKAFFKKVRGGADKDEIKALMDSDETLVQYRNFVSSYTLNCAGLERLFIPHPDYSFRMAGPL